MSCEEFMRNRSRSHAESRANQTASSDGEYADVVRFIFTTVGLPIICSFGIAGNLLNLAVLTRKQLQRSMDTMEKSAHLGLVALAVSDLLFCIFAIPIGFIPENKYLYTSDESLVPVYYDIYVKIPVVNIFIVCSSWLTVVMASARYFAICRPLHARGFINLSGTRIAITCVFLASILLNLPLFWYFRVLKWPCAAQCTCYMQANGHLLLRKTFVFIYQIVWAILGYLIPMIVLAFCNYCLIRALRESSRTQRKYRVNKPKDSGHRITPTLITIVILFIVLVVPAEINKFVHKLSSISSHASSVAIHVTNFLQASNFAINFILYCALNVHFRKIVKYLFCCEWYSKKVKFDNGHTTNHTMTLMTDMETDIQTV